MLKLFLWFLRLQVSLYGHSLGSVLSYDILCHQETLTSPFPMEWIFKDQIKYETCTPNDMKSSSSSRGKDFNEIVTMDSKKLDSPTLLDQDVLGFDIGLGETLSDKDNDLDDCAEMASGSNQIDEEICQHDEDTTIKSLREEVNNFHYSRFFAVYYFLYPN